MLKKWNKVNSTVLFKNPWWTYKCDHFTIEKDLGDDLAGEYHYVHTNGSSMVIPVTTSGKIILVNQYRYLCARESFEFPCGGVRNGNSFLETAHYELSEETGFDTKQMKNIGEFNPYNGVTDEICNLYLANELYPSAARPDETEEFELRYVDADEIDEMINKNLIWDGMTLAAWMLSRIHFN